MRVVEFCSRGAIGGILVCTLSATGQAFGQSTLKEAKMGSKENKGSGSDASNSRQNTAVGLCQGIFDDLRSGRYVKDEAILRCVEAFVNSGDSKSAIRFIRDLQPLLSDRPKLRAQMLTREGSIWISSGNFKEAAASFQSSLEIIEPVHLEVDLLRLSTLVEAGESLLSLCRKSEAEAYFLGALSYSWYTVVGHPTEMQRLRDQYIFAGRGLIESRRGNLEALKQIVFVPATSKDLGPVLDRAIEEAKASSQSVDQK
jgi:hypothetical protein